MNIQNQFSTILTLSSALICGNVMASTSPVIDSTTNIPTTASLLGLASMDDDATEVATEEKSPWTGNIGLSLSGNQGSSDTFTFRFSAGATRKTAMEEFNVNVMYYFEYENSVQKENNGNLSINQIWNIEKNSALNVFAEGNWLYDATEGYKTRLNGYTGIGYKLVNEEDRTVNLKLGGGAQWEYRGNTAIRPQTLLGMNTSWQISKGVKLTASASIANDVQNFNHYLATGQMQFEISIADVQGLALTTGIRDIYNSNPGADSSFNQLWYWIGLKYGF